MPGVNETLRVNGSAKISPDPSLLERFKVRDRLPVSVIVVTVNEAFLHCAKELVRSALWDSSLHINRSDFPTLGQMLSDQISGLDAIETERHVQDSMRNRLY